MGLVSLREEGETRARFLQVGEHRARGHQPHKQQCPRLSQTCGNLTLGLLASSTARSKRLQFRPRQWDFVMECEGLDRGLREMDETGDPDPSSAFNKRMTLGKFFTLQNLRGGREAKLPLSFA